MNTMQFLQAVLNWLSADPSHVVLAASVLCAITPTPAPGTLSGKIYKILDVLAVNFLNAKSTGAPEKKLEDQVAELVSQYVSKQQKEETK